MPERGRPFAESSLRTGRPGSFLVNATVDVEPGQTLRWHICADVAQGHEDIARLVGELRSSDDLFQQVDDDIDLCSRELHDIVASADGVQTTASPKVDAHHLANTLFNVMRGGTFAHGYSVESERFRSFVAERNVDAVDRHAGLARGPSRLDRRRRSPRSVPSNSVIRT